MKTKLLWTLLFLLTLIFVWLCQMETDWQCKTNHQFRVGFDQLAATLQVPYRALPQKPRSSSEMPYSALE
jgi:hypothetical protein